MQAEIDVPVLTGQERAYMGELVTFAAPYIQRIRYRYSEDIQVVLTLHCAVLVFGDSRLALAAPFSAEIRTAVREDFSLSLAVAFMAPMLTRMQLDSGLVSNMRPSEALRLYNMCIEMGWSRGTPGALATVNSPLAYLDQRAQLRASVPPRDAPPPQTLQPPPRPQAPQLPLPKPRRTFDALDHQQ